MTEQELNAIKAAKITAPDMPISMNAASERLNTLAVEWEEHPEHFEDVNPFFVAVRKIRDKSLEWKAEPVVRCGECRFGIVVKNGYGEYIVICENPDSPSIEQIAIMPDWFCADGERRESE